MRVELRARATGYGGYGTTDEHQARIACLLEEVLPLSGRVFAPADETCSAVSLEIRHIPTHGGEDNLDETLSLIHSLMPVAILEFTTAVEVEEAAAFRSMQVERANEAIVLAAIAKRRLEEAVATLSLAIAIGHPSDLRLDTPAFLPNDDMFAPSVRWGDVGRGKNIAAEIGWPPLRTLPVGQVLDWLEALPGWRDGVGQGPVGRAVAALSQALAIERGQASALSLVWAMVGLEALFCRNREGLKSQLSTNVQLLLGRWSSHKRRFGNVYDFRSAFLHGALDVPFAHRGRQDDDAALRFMWDSDEEAGLAMVTLLASIQELIARDWHQLNFATSIVTSEGR